MEYLGNTKSVNSLQPLVSVVVVTYNQEYYIKQCLESILAQKVNFKYEIIIGEDASTDSTTAICKQFAKENKDNIRLFLRSRKDVIYINKRATGRYNLIESIKEAKGKYIALLEGDDYWTDLEKLQKQVDFLDNTPNVSLCFHKTRTVTPVGEVISQMQESTIKIHKGKQKLKQHIPTLSTCFKNKLQPWPKEIYQTPYGDLILWAILAEIGDFADLGFLGASYRKHSGGVFSKMNKIDQIKNTLLTRRLTLRIATQLNKLAIISKMLEADYIGLKISIKTGSMIGVLFFGKDYLTNLGHLIHARRLSI